MEHLEFSEDLKNQVLPLLEESGAELIELNYIRRSGRSILRLLVDKKEGGITIQECAELNKKIISLLDEKDLIKEGYLLEVSSPGLDRPLKVKNDFSRCINKEIRVFLREPLNEKWELSGFIAGVEGEVLQLNTDKGQISIPLAIINRAKQII